MDKKVGVFQIATVFIGSIVGAGLSSGRELNQFFSVYGYKSMLGLVMCALSYIIVGKMMIEISRAHKTKSYSEFVSLVCHRKVAWFTNVTLTLFLVCSTGIILAGSSAVINQYFGVPKWIGFVVMIGCSIIFLLRDTNGLFEVNRFVVPCLLLIMTSIFIGFIKANPQTLSLHYLQALPTEKTHYWPSSIVYASFNIISIVGIIVPLTYELQDTKVLVRGVALGSALLTLISFFISFLMLVNPTYPMTYEIPILAVAGQVGPLLQTGLMLVIWLEMFSSQIANIYSVTRSLETQFNMPYKKGIFIILCVAMPLSFLGFAKLVEVLYPLYGILSLVFVGSCVYFYFKERISVIPRKKNKQKISPLHKI